MWVATCQWSSVACLRWIFWTGPYGVISFKKRVAASICNEHVDSICQNVRAGLLVLFSWALCPQAPGGCLAHKSYSVWLNGCWSNSSLLCIHCVQVTLTSLSPLLYPSSILLVTSSWVHLFSCLLPIRSSSPWEPMSYSPDSWHPLIQPTIWQEFLFDKRDLLKRQGVRIPKFYSQFCCELLWISWCVKRRLHLPTSSIAGSMK